MTKDLIVYPLPLSSTGKRPVEIAIRSHRSRED